MMDRIAKMGRTLYGVFGILVIWMLLDFFIMSAVVPAPFETISYFIRHLDQVLIHLLYSFYRIVVAISFSLLIGIPLGMVMGLLRWGDSILSPIVYLAYPIPKIAFLPVFMILFGLGDLSKIILIFSIIVFQIMIGVRDGIKAIPQEVHLSSQSLGLNSWDKIGHIIFPSILPKLLSSLRISIGIAMSALFLGENYATTYGIGYYIMNNWIMVDYLAMFSGIVGLSLMGLVIFSGIDWIESQWCRWTK
jgi:NitT/TauT family transport system permease protein